MTVQLLLLLLSLTGLAVGALVSERESSHRELAGIARRFQSMVEKSHEGVLLLNARGEILHDLGRQQILGHQPSDFLARSAFDFIHPADHVSVYQAFSLWLEKPGASTVVECRVRDKDGSYRWIEVIGTNWLKDPAIGVLVLNYRDVTERKAAQEALRQSEARYRELFENAAFGVYRSTPDGRILDVNPAFVRMFGYDSVEEMKGVNARDLWHDQTARARTLEKYREVHRFESVELEFKRKDGSLLLARLYGRQVHDVHNQIVYFEGIVEDVTERRQLEAQLRNSQKMEAVGRLAGGVAHDFNNLLGVILGYSDVMLEELTPTSPLGRNVVEIKKAADRAAYLTRQLLAFGRKQVLQPKALNLNRVVCDMTELLNRLIGEHIALVTRLDPKLSNIRADPNQLEQVIMNLAVNARDAMPQGGRLILETANVDLRPGGVHAAPGQYALLRVIDTGMGMDQETQARIFEPFFTTKPMEKGTGLGLATVYGIVEQSGGHIRVDSAAGRGTSFEVYFPVAEVQAEVYAELETHAAVPRGEQTILLVEDEPALRQLVRDVLSSHGYKVLDAADGTTAVRLADTHLGAIHLLLTDVILPGMNGLEIAQHLIGARPGVRVLFISGYTRESKLDQGAFAGTPFLQKPFSPGALIQKIHEVLHRGTIH